MRSSRADPGETLLTLQTRQIILPGGSARAFTYTLLVWRAFEYLVDQGHATIEEILAHAMLPGWELPNAPLEMRLSSVIAKRTHDCDRRFGDYDRYCRG